MGCGDPFPELNTPVTLTDSTPLDTAPPVDTSPTGETGFTTTTPEPTKPKPTDVIFEIDLEKIQLLTQNCDVFPNGPAADIYYDLRVGDQYGWTLTTMIAPADNVDMEAGDELLLDVEPVRLVLGEKGDDQIIIFGQVYDRDGTQENQLIANYDDLVWTLPADVPVGERVFTREGPTEADPDRRCEVSLFATITEIDNEYE